MNDPIPKDWDVPAIFRARMGTQAGRQRAMMADGHVLLVLHELPDPLSPGKRKARLFWRKPDGGYRTSHVPAATTVSRFASTSSSTSPRRKHSRIASSPPDVR